MTKPLAKSLHTISVLVNVARHCAATARTVDGITGPLWAGYVAQASRILGLDGKPDTYGLINAAIKQLNK